MWLKVCTPVYRRELIEPRMLMSVASVLEAFPGSEHLYSVGALVATNRNLALRAGGPLSNFSHVLFVDTDMAFTPEHVQKLIARDVPIISAAYAFRGAPGCYCAAVGSATPSVEGTRVRTTERGLRSVLWVGAGFLLVRAEVLRDWPDPWRHEGTMGEDVTWCIDAARKGHTVWLDCDCVVEHILQTEVGMGKMEAQQQQQPSPAAQLDAAMDRALEGLAAAQQLLLTYRKITRQMTHALSQQQQKAQAEPEQTPSG